MTEHNTERRIERTTTEARAGVTHHNVRYVLAASLLGVIIAFAGLWYFWAAQQRAHPLAVQLLVNPMRLARSRNHTRPIFPTG